MSATRDAHRSDQVSVPAEKRPPGDGIGGLQLPYTLSDNHPPRKPLYLVPAIASQQSVGPEKERLQDLTLGPQSQEGQLLGLHPQYVGALQAAAFRSLGPLSGYPELGAWKKHTERGRSAGAG